ncbi:hypothetical protein [Rickettsia felis]|uniref:hypothetical protein n=1 Tax=Rickettsia felis TaxID=42862 RepID=UPI0009D75E8A|nr:hypothetical protein [Rickettsia felis]
MRGNCIAIDEAISGACYYFMRLPRRFAPRNDDLVSTQVLRSFTMTNVSRVCLVASLFSVPQSSPSLQSQPSLCLLPFAYARNKQGH